MGLLCFEMIHLNKDIFSIPVGGFVGKESDSIRILYSPLADSLLLASEYDAQRILDYIDGEDKSSDEEIIDAAESLMHTLNAEDAEKVPDLRHVTNLSVMSNYICNFHCSYCYSAKGRDSKRLEWNKAELVLRWFVSHARFDSGEVPVLSLFISGGGEPLVTWSDLTKPMIELARMLSCEQGIRLRIAIITNGSLLTDEIATFLHDNDCAVGVSFEVLEHLQDRQRAHYHQVVNALNILREHNVETRVNCTITPMSVDYMAAIVSEIATRWNFIKEFTMEPVTSTDLFASAAQMRQFYDSYLTNYIESKHVAVTEGVNLRFTYDDVFRVTTVRHCHGKFCLTPMGTISICHLVTSPKEPRYSHCVYGQVTDEGIRLDENKFSELYKLNILHFEECKHCFAKWVCGGECLTRRETYPSDYFAELCRFNKRFLTMQLLKRIEQNVMDATGLTLCEYVRQ